MSYEKMQIHTILGFGVSVLLILANLGGVWLCLLHRKLTGWLSMAALGFAGLSFSAVIGLFAAFAFRDWVEWGTLAFLLGTFIASGSSLVLVFGLGASLVDLRKKLSRSLDPPNARH